MTTQQGPLWAFTVFGEESASPLLPLKAEWLWLDTSPRPQGLFPGVPTQVMHQHPPESFEKTDLELHTWRF